MSDGGEWTNLVLTEDGSLTRFDPGTGELYHNRAGAYTEALKNYFEPSEALRTLTRQGSLALVDACFGLGYNTLVLLERLLCERASGTVRIWAVEQDSTILRSVPLVLRYQRFATLALHREELQTLPSSREIRIRQGELDVILHMVAADLRRFAVSFNDDVDLIFHDPFSPRKVPELWTADLFYQYRRIVGQRRGRVLTYSTAAAVLAGLNEAGFHLYRTAPVGGKRGGTMALHPEAQSPSCAVEQSLAESCATGVPYRDPNLRSSRQMIISRRLAEQSIHSDCRRNSISV